ncbi:MAG: isocitrate lyase/phosphoenolpyruvate mutase family protein [Pseudomonadales bacterium]
MNQTEKAKYFAQLHERGNPCVLYNIWDVAGARAVTKVGAKAVASGSCLHRCGCQWHFCSWSC